MMTRMTAKLNTKIVRYLYSVLRKDRAPCEREKRKRLRENPQS
jgi:hypothetical protein